MNQDVWLLSGRDAYHIIATSAVEFLPGIFVACHSGLSLSLPSFPVFTATIK